MFDRSTDDDESKVKDMAKGAAKTVAASKAVNAVTSDEDDEKSGGKGKFLALLLVGAGAAGYFWKKRQGKARWDEPRSL